MIRLLSHQLGTAGLLAVLLLFGAAPIALAQEPPSFRAAPPREPDVLRAAPDPGAVAQENRDIASRWLDAGDAAMQSLAKTGGTLTNIVTGNFTRLSRTIAITGAASMLGAVSALDVRGAVSEAAATVVGGNVTAGGAALFGEIGAVTGGAVGSFFPVIGNIAGSMVGGAVGTAAGGFICAFGYDKYVKDYVAKGVTGIVSAFDTAPLTRAMEAKRAFLWATMAPEERAQLQGFNREEVTLLDFGTLPYVLVPKQPAPDAQQQAALPPAVVGDLLVGVRKIMLDGPTICTIDSGRVDCTQPPANIGSAVRIVSRSLAGVVAGNILELEWRDVFESHDERCTNRTVYQGHRQFALEADGRALDKGSVTMTSSVSGNPGICGKSMTRTGNGTNVGTWRVLE